MLRSAESARSGSAGWGSLRVGAVPLLRDTAGSTERRTAALLRPLLCSGLGGGDGTQLPLSWGGFEWGPHGARAKAQQPSTTLFCVALSIQNDTPSTVQSGTARGVKISSGGGRAAGGDGDTAGGGGSARRSPHCRGGWGGGGRAWGCRAAVLGGAGCPHLVQSSVANACPRGRGGEGGAQSAAVGRPSPNLRGAARGAAAAEGGRLRPRARVGGP